uniref:Rho-GAP domain-containing protein n=1 Tax=Steinernema glaseri TaxID=37863 RepID=A0A1I7ZH62_9BILA
MLKKNTCHSGNPKPNALNCVRDCDECVSLNPIHASTGYVTLMALLKQEPDMPPPTSVLSALRVLWTCVRMLNPEFLVVRTLPDETIKEAFTLHDCSPSSAF